MGQTTCLPLSVGHSSEMVASGVTREKDQMGCESEKVPMVVGGLKEPLKAGLP